MVKMSGLDCEGLAELFNKKEEEQSKATNLDNKISADAVRNHMHKVAFDVYNVDNDPYDSLWRLESSADDGKEYLVRMDADNSTSEGKTGNWSVLSNESGTSVTLAYRKIPMQRLSGKIFGFSKDDVGIFKRALLEKVTNDESFKEKILDMQSEERKAELVKAFPELMVTQK